LFFAKEPFRLWLFCPRFSNFFPPKSIPDTNGHPPVRFLVHLESSNSQRSLRTKKLFQRLLLTFYCGEFPHVSFGFEPQSEHPIKLRLVNSPRSSDLFTYSRWLSLVAISGSFFVRSPSQICAEDLPPFSPSSRKFLNEGKVPRFDATC